MVDYYQKYSDSLESIVIKSKQIQQELCLNTSKAVMNNRVEKRSNNETTI